MKFSIKNINGILFVIDRNYKTYTLQDLLFSYGWAKIKQK